MKTCTRCGITKDLNDFQKRSASKDGLTSSCKECLCSYDRSRNMLPHRVQARKDYKKTEKGKSVHIKAIKKYRNANPEKYKAHIILSNAIRDNKIIVPNKCSQCGKSNCKIEGHHYDYSKPLSVIWCCVDCHSEIHKKLNSE